MNCFSGKMRYRAWPFGDVIFAPSVFINVLVNMRI